MGRIKTQQIKRTVRILINKNPNTFTTTFDQNKKLADEKAEIRSKKLRNVIAGSLTRQIKSQQD